MSKKVKNRVCVEMYLKNHFSLRHSFDDDFGETVNKIIKFTRKNIVT